MLGRRGLAGTSVVRQRGRNDCGAASLATVAAYHGCVVDYDKLVEELAFDRHGTNLLALSRSAERLGFRVNGVRASYDSIAKCRLPVIVHLRYRLGGGHFVVIHQWTAAEVVIGDPAVGVRRLSRKRLCGDTSQPLLLLEIEPHE
jgi:ABC-type bacteriocin/lantibiotic exporter with double-glycine peptidase domain